MADAAYIRPTGNTAEFIAALDFDKAGGLMPAVVQHVQTGAVLMVGFMNPEALTQTLESKRVTFYSRTKGRLWTKGETSGNYLHVQDIVADCDRDTVLIQALPDGPTCHTGADTCFGADAQNPLAFIAHLERTIAARKGTDPESSYTAKLFQKGIRKIAQKVGEEAVETILEAEVGTDDLFLNEASDLFFHYLVLLQARGFTLQDVTRILAARHKK